MKTVYVGTVRTFGNIVGDVIPVLREDTEIAYGIVRQAKVIPAFGHEQFLPIAIAEIKRERPDIQWT